VAERRRRKTLERRSFSTPPAWVSVLRPFVNVCMCGYPYCKASYIFGYEMWSYSQHGYNLDKNHFIFM